jgi:REP element-mobilizing transposase RayT
MELNELGRIVSAHWQHLPTHHPNLILDEFVVMPNHIHGILVLTHHFRNAAVAIVLKVKRKGKFF